MAYERIEPFGERRQDWRMAVLASLLLNMVRGKDDKALTPAGFLEMIEADGKAVDPCPRREPRASPGDLEERFRRQEAEHEDEESQTQREEREDDD